MKFQKGLSLTGLMTWGVVIGLGAVLGMKVVPAYIEFGKTQAAIKKVVNQAGSYPSLDTLRSSYSRFADIDQLDLKATDLRFKPEGEKVIIEFSYDKTIPLVSNAYLVLKFEGSSKN